MWHHYVTNYSEQTWFSVFDFSRCWICFSVLKFSCGLLSQETLYIKVKIYRKVLSSLVWKLKKENPNKTIYSKLGSITFSQWEKAVKQLYYPSQSLKTQLLLNRIRIPLSRSLMRLLPLLTPPRCWVTVTSPNTAQIITYNSCQECCYIRYNLTYCLSYIFIIHIYFQCWVSS